MKHDLVVFVPGITGTRLTRDGKDLWHQSRQALLGALPFSRAVERLRLPDDIGDHRPEEPWAVEATELVKSPEALPGFLAHLGYPDARTMLTGLVPEQYALFPYDWRLSNRVTADSLRTFVERELSRWRGQVERFHPRAEDPPRVILLCHSMGGLVGRYYLECLGGRDITRALVTLGTPHRGAAKAVRFLTGHGVPTEGWGAVRRSLAGAAARRVNEQLAELCRTFPSMGQLLPVYAAVRRPEFPEGHHEHLTSIDVGLPSALVADAFDFHGEFEDAVRKNRRNSDEGELPYRVHCLGGRSHPTVHGVVVAPEKIEFSLALDDEEPWTGDGTVPEESAFARWALRGMDEAVWNGHRHANLTSADAFGHQLTAVLNGKSARETLAADDEFGIVVPELAVSGEPFEVTAVGVERGRTVRMGLHRSGDAGPGEWTDLAPGEPDELRGELVAGPGTWVLSVVADRPQVTQRDVVLVVEA
ncbi:hypothetical protein [Streptomyces sp. NPDC088789]|uniref:lipase/acyltransferase domain-containing protein n=1 Tax=Streptomyces sp. NPDC088789 TaxID=3365899 RepID=UPI0037F5878A